MLKKVLCVVLSLVLALGAVSVAAFAATADDLAAAVATLPDDYNAQFYNDKTVAAIKAAKDAAAAASSEAEIEAAIALCDEAYALVTETALDAWDAEYFVNREESKAVVNYNVSADTSKVKPGESFDVTVSIQSNFVIGSGRFSLAYDSTVLEVTNVAHPAEMETTIIYNNPSNDFMDPNNSDLVPMEWLYDDNGVAAIDKYDLFSMAITCNTAGAVTGETEVWFPQDAADELFTVTFTVKEDAADGVARVFVDDTLDCKYFEYETDEYFLEDLINFQRGNHKHVRPETLVTSYEGALLDNGAAAFDMQAGYDQTIVYGAGNGAATYTSTDVYGGQEVAVNGVAVDVEIASTKPADYTKLDAAVGEAANYSANDWTADSYKALTDAVEAANNCSRDLTEEEQATIDALEADIYTAIDGLVRQQAEGCPIVSITANGEIKYLQYANLSVVVKDAPAWKIRFVDSDGNTVTVANDCNLVNSITANEDGTETWNIKVPTYKLSEQYSVYVRYEETGWNPIAYVYDMEAVDPDTIDGRFISYDIVDDYEGAIYQGVNTITVVTGVDVNKVQFMEKGNTWTYTAATASYVDADGVRTWTIKMNFPSLGDHSFDIRTRTVKTTFASTGETMDVTVFSK
ncbi:MAG: hypothetical protein IJZ57_05585 [Clostridia bacterium]|nr:hypothetical protein [Clostridia bacterium]